MVELAPAHCARLHGGSVADCACRLPNQGGWLACPPEARGSLGPAPAPAPSPPITSSGGAAVAAQEKPKQLAGDFCQDCGSPNMMRTGTCLTCRDCGSTSGGCS